MKTMKIPFFFTEMGCEKGNILNFHVIFFNKDISITVADIILKYCVCQFFMSFPREACLRFLI